MLAFFISKCPEEVNKYQKRKKLYASRDYGHAYPRMALNITFYKDLSKCSDILECSTSISII